MRDTDKTIDKLIEYANEELMDAEKYARCALANKDSDKALADVYFAIAKEEMNHHAMEHAQIERILSSPDL